MRIQAVLQTIKKALALFSFLFLTLAASARPGDTDTASKYELSNARIAARFVVANGGIQIANVEDRRSHSMLYPTEAFSLQFRGGRVIAASQLRMDAAPEERDLMPVPLSSRRSEQVAGKEICADLTEKENLLTVHWCAVLRRGANYLRQEVTVKAGTQSVDIAEVRMFDFEVPGARVVGKVKGSPMVASDFFFGFEFPLSVSSIKSQRATAVLTRTLPLTAGQSITYSSVIGVAAPGQLRRDFLAYIEMERAHPYRTFLHYNTWYDLGEGGRYTDAQALDRIHWFGEELVRKRGVTIDSFLFDDGWDDTHNLWAFDSGFPEGFANVRRAAAQYGFGIGVWFSPWGGYDKEKDERVATGTKAGFETVKGGFALSGPHYYNLFEKRLLEMVERFGVNQFKIDGTGNVDQVYPGSLFDSDFSAAIHLIEQLRRQDSNNFVNLTTGTWPSPFWLRYADSIWRGGRDHGFSGVGSWRQQWITFRDAHTYSDTVESGPLFPLNSLMLHGIIYGATVEHLQTDPNGDFSDEVRSYFGTGTQLQEMYITPSLLSKHDWDVLAECARWSRTNADVLEDTHWIGGNPNMLEVYGWASWTPQKAIIVLRNPSDHAQKFEIDVKKVFELPDQAPKTYQAHSPWAADRALAGLTLRVGHPQRITLNPFQVLTLDAMPAE